MKYHPTAGRVLIRRERPKEKTEGGLYKPDTVKAKEVSRSAEVVAVGPGVVTESGFMVEPRIRVGDRVLVAGNFGSSVLKSSLETGGDYVLQVVLEKDIMCIVEDDEG